MKKLIFILISITFSNVSIQAQDCSTDGNYCLNHSSCNNISITVSTTGNMTTYVPNSSLYTKMFDEQFTGTTIDDNLWKVWDYDECGLPGSGNCILSNPSNVVKGKGQLKLNFTKTSYMGSTYSGAVVNSYTCGPPWYAVNYFQGCFIEIRAKMPLGHALWPALWMFAGSGVQDYQEFDIIEGFGSN